MLAAPWNEGLGFGISKTWRIRGDGVCGAPKRLVGHLSWRNRLGVTAECRLTQRVHPPARAKRATGLPAPRR
jgi:hypothetical protein